MRGISHYPQMIVHYINNIYIYTYIYIILSHYKSPIFFPQICYFPWYKLMDTSAEETVCVSEISCTLRFLGRQMRSWGHGIYIYIYQLGNLPLGLLNLFFENVRAIRAIFLCPDPWSWNHVWMVVSGIPDFSMPIKMTWIRVETASLRLEHDLQMVELADRSIPSNAN